MKTETEREKSGGKAQGFARHCRTCVLVLILLVGIASVPVLADEPGALNPDAQEKSYAVAVRKQTVYLGKGRNVYVLDVSDPGAPDVKGRVTLPALVRDIDVNGNQLYVADSEAGLRIINVSDDTDPRETGSIKFNGRADGLTHDEKYVYVAARRAGLRIVDVSNPSEPEEIGAFETEEPAADVAVSDDLAHVAATFGGHRIIDVRDPSKPEEIGSAKRGSYTHGFSWGIDLDKKFAYVANVEVGLRRVKITGINRSNKNNKAGTAALKKDVHRPTDVTVAGDYTYLADQGAGLRLFFSGKGGKFFEVSRVNIPDRAMDVAVNDGTAYVASRGAGLRIVDVSDAFNPSVIGYWDPDPHVVDLAASGSQLFLADGHSGMRVVPVSDPTTYKKKRFFNGRVDQVVVDGDAVFVAAGPEGVTVLDSSAQKDLRQVDQVNTDGPATDLSVTDQYVLVSEKKAGIELFRRTSEGPLERTGTFDPERSREGRFYKNPVFVWSPTVHDTTAFLLCDDGIRAVDLSDPSKPKQIGFLPTDERARRAEFRTGRLFVAFDDGVRVVDVSDPSKMTVSGFLDTRGIPTDLEVRDDVAYVTEFDHGLRIVDVSDPGNPETSRVISTGGRRCHALKVVDRRVFIAAGRAGLHVVELSGSDGN